MKMKTKVLTTLLGLAVLAIPAAVPASQPADVRVGDLAPALQVAPAPANLAMLLADPNAVDDLAIVLPAGYTTFEWIDQDPFAL
jgi:hypothetical protein